MPKKLMFPLRERLENYLAKHFDKKDVGRISMYLLKRKVGKYEIVKEKKGEYHDTTSFGKLYMNHYFINYELHGWVYIKTTNDEYLRAHISIEDGGCLTKEEFDRYYNI